MIGMDSRKNSLAHFVRLSAHRFPTNTFLETVDGQIWTYQQVYETSLVYAHALRRLGVEAYAQVAIMLPTGVEATLLWIACAWLRAHRVAVHVDEGFDGLPLQQGVRRASI